ncbi:MAG: PAS domain S-box protein [Planctomycetota bacterium]
MELLPSPAALVLGVPADLEAASLGEVEIVLSQGAEELARDLASGDASLVERAARIALDAGGGGLEEHRRSDGEAVWLRATLRPVETGVLIEFRDESSIAREREALARDRRLLDALIEAMPGAIAVSDACDGFRVLRSNRRFEDLCGRTRQELAGRPTDDVWGEERAAREQVEDERTFESAGRTVRETVARVAGDRRPVRVTRIPVFDDAGAADQLVSMLEEVTPRQRSRQVAEARADQLGILFEFLGATAERDVGALVDLLDARVDDSAAHRTMDAHEVLGLRESLAGFLDGVHGVLRASAALARLPQPSARSFDPLALVEDVVGGAEQRAAREGVTLRVDDRIDVDLGLDFVADAPCIRLALEHLVEDALSGSEPGLELIVTLDCDSERGALLFGLRERSAQSEAWPAAPRRRSLRNGGLGWGLAMQLADAMGGALSSGRTPGGGLACTLEVPLALGSRGSTEPARSRRILVAECSVASQRILRRRLELLGAEVVIASTEGEAIETVRAAAAAFDTVLVDAEIDGERGARLVARIRAVEADRALPRMEVATLTRALEGTEQAKLDDGRARAAGAERSISKPLREVDFQVIAGRA